ncbi:hypothetical protein [Calothrix sp. PCC 7507]|uniref:hypothetical protein n=1 Tax=Calothrix sp. PCC 7507 TaxID=99598 RepID=UPI00029EFC0F|nr:hypothetical protein [Calothrix sp. PCC 7507]AFY34382.1 hypothetical protein Cal7507_3997 [Calothrix sp. PCC 7507]
MTNSDTDILYEAIVIRQEQNYKGWICEISMGYPTGVICLKFTKQMIIEKRSDPIKSTTDSKLIYIGNTQRHPNWQYEAWLRAKSDIDALEKNQPEG